MVNCTSGSTERMFSGQGPTGSRSRRRPTLTVVISVWWQSRLTWRRPQKAPPTRWMARLQHLKDITVSGMKATMPGRHPQAIHITCLNFTRFGPSRGAGENFSDPASIHSMGSGTAIYRGYGASKFRPLLESLSNEEWLHVYEDDTFVYVELRKAENFYQLPVTVNDRHDVSGGIEATVDVFSDQGHHNQVLSGLHVIANAGSDISGRLNSADNIRFLLGIFSVNLRKAEDLASGHQGHDNAVFAPSALEFFAYGVPLGRAVASSSGCR